MSERAVDYQAADIARLVPDGSTVALTGAGIFLEPDEILAALEKSFLETGHPRDLTVVHALGIGDGKASGMARFAHNGMTRRVIGGHWSWSPAMQAMARENRVEAYSFPAGAISSLLREIGAGRPGLTTRIGLGTFADPAVDGGRCNEVAKDNLVERVELDGETYLRYKPLKIDVGIVRGSEVDPRGNIGFVREPADLDACAVALAAHNSGGVVLAQVECRRENPILPARLARMPGILVDAVLVAPHARKTYLPDYDPHLSGELHADPQAAVQPMEQPVGIRRIIAERAMREIDGARSVNFGYGIPGGIPALLQKAGKTDYWGTVEQGIHNGRMLDGPMFGSAWNADAIIPSVDQFDFYSGGGIDTAFLGMGEMDASGNVNVSRIGGILVGPGGFVDITQTADKVVFCGTFEAKGLKVDQTPGGELSILNPGEVAKLVEHVEHITFSGEQARHLDQEVIYVTERAVFRLDPDGIALIEMAPGIDLQADILQRMQFEPIVRLQERGEPTKAS
jgi:acyl CoA:acetate/3-ketoacid CoA transferase